MFQNKTEIVMAAVSRIYLLYLLLRRRVILLYLQRQRKLKLNKEKKRRFWIRKLSEERSQKGEYQLLIRDLRS